VLAKVKVELLMVDYACEEFSPLGMVFIFFSYLILAMDYRFN
jgi:hypothetical protein